MIRALFAAFVLSWLPAVHATAQVELSPSQAHGVTALLQRLEEVLRSGDPEAYLALLADSASRDRAREFAGAELPAGVTRAVIQERAREPLFGELVGDGYEMVVDVFVERAARARIATWRLEVTRTREAEAPGEVDEFRIDDQERLNVFDGLYKITLDRTRQFDARNLTITAEDLRLTVAEGSVFVASTEAGVTGVVVLGRGDMVFSPPTPTEQGQVRIFSGSDVLETAFDAAFIRLHPSDFASTVDSRQLTARAVDARELQRAEEVFLTESEKSYNLDLADLSPEDWSLLPATGDLLAEIRTRRFDTLTYAREANEAEDITLFDRERLRNIALYPSAQQIAQGGRFYNDDDLADYDIESYDIDLSITPEREWVEGYAQIRLKVKSLALGALTMRLADSLVLQEVSSDQHGRLLGLRVRDQNTIVINLPGGLPRDTVVDLNIGYAGRLPPQVAEREAINLGGGQQLGDPAPRLPTFDGAFNTDPIVPGEPAYLYSSRVYWHPQGTRSDFATASLRVNVPGRYTVIASGEPAPDSPAMVPAEDPALARLVYSFDATRPQRYLALLVSRFERAVETTLDFAPYEDSDELPALDGGRGDSMKLVIEAHPRQVGVGRDMAESAEQIARFYAGLLGDSPYPSFTIALVESDLPGGHSPAYFAQLNTPLPMMRFAWRNDPVVFAAFPEFFLAHELAHQWWGQAVGWGNYHEQWLSEGFAQYFAALYAQQHHGDGTFGEVLQQLRKWGLDESDQGPIYLGYRLGHLRGEPRVFRALVYNKGAAVLHMLRRLVGDEVFFRGLRRFYAESRFSKVGTEDFRRAMEAEAGRSLERFFEGWIYSAALPTLRFSHRVDGSEAVLHFEQIGQVFDMPVTVTLQYADNSRADVMVPVGEQVTEVRVPLAGALRSAQVRTDDGTLLENVR